jgi:DNA-binding NarL/FixJ family response regulator
VGTVKSHVQSILAKLKAAAHRSRRMAIHLGMT